MVGHIEPTANNQPLGLETELINIDESINSFTLRAHISRWIQTYHWWAQDRHEGNHWKAELKDGNVRDKGKNMTMWWSLQVWAHNNAFPWNRSLSTIPVLRRGKRGNRKENNHSPTAQVPFHLHSWSIVEANLESSCLAQPRFPWGQESTSSLRVQLTQYSNLYARPFQMQASLVG